MNDYKSKSAFVVAIVFVGFFAARDLIYEPGFRLATVEQTIEAQPAAEKATVEFQVASIRTPTIVTSVTTSCDCICFDGLPVEIPANEEATITATIDLTKIKLPSKRYFRFNLNPPGKHVAVVNLRPAGVAGTENQ